LEAYRTEPLRTKVVIIAPAWLEEALSVLILSVSSLELVASAPVINEAFANPLASEPDLVLINGMRELELACDQISRVKSFWPCAHIIILADHIRQREDLRAAGADQVLIKGISPQYLFETLQQVQVNRSGSSPVGVRKNNNGKDPAKVRSSSGNTSSLQVETDIPNNAVEAICEIHRIKLEQIGINSAEELLERGATVQDRMELARKTGLCEPLILGWVRRADLMRVTGYAAEYSDLLVASGVDTVVELAQRNPENLFEKISRVNEQKTIVMDLPSFMQVKGWVEAAQSMPRKVFY
jgi:DNA-binding NarL/FixJ family response regulator